MVKNLPDVQETQVRSLGREDHLEKKMETHSSVLAWTISWTEEPGGLQSMGCTNMPEYTHTVTQNTFLDKGIDDIMAKTQAGFVFKKKKKALFT